MRRAAAQQWVGADDLAVPPHLALRANIRETAVASSSTLRYSAHHPYPTPCVALTSSSPSCLALAQALVREASERAVQQ